MNWAVLRTEWGAVTFVLTVIVGMVIVPVALYFANVSPGPVTTPSINVTSSARSSSITPSKARTSPTPKATPKASPTK